MEREIGELKAIAQVYRRRKHPRLAIELLKTALSMQQGLHGRDSQLVAATTYELAETYTEARRIDLAHPLYMEAVRIWQIHHPTTTADLVSFSHAMQRLQDEGQFGGSGSQSSSAA